MAEHIVHIFDKVFKKILTLSAKAVINLINGLFGTTYPEDSTITYNWTEFMDTELRRTLADTIITVNGRYSYHIEAQLEKDGDIVFRVFEYGYHHADRMRASTQEYYVLHFPEPKIIYLYATKDIPDTYTLRLDFGTQGYFDYKVPVLKYLETSLDELNQKKLIILIPFQLLKLRKLLQKSRSPENLKALQNLIQHDILGSIDSNYRYGNISMNDAYRLQRLTKQLYDYIYAHYAEMEVLNDMVDESLLLDIDIVEMQYEKKLTAMETVLNEKDSALAEKDTALAEKDTALAEKDSALAEKDFEIERLKAEIEKLKQR